MSKIEFEQISEDVVEVVIPPETPMEMVQQLTKSFVSRGLVEDLAKSTLSVRYFYRPQTEDVADKLIKSLSRLTKNDELPYWHPKSQFANQKRVREMEISERRAKNGIQQPSNVSTAPEPHVMPDAAPKMPAPAATTATANTLSPQKYTAPHPKMVDTGPAAQMTAGGTGRRYATINDPVGKAEDEEETEKSDYGPKGGGQYDANANARRKANNVETVGVGPNKNSKAYSTKPGQLSGKAQASLTSRIQNAANKKQPVKTWSPEEIAAENKKRGLTKSWGQHLPFPSAEEEIMRLAKNESVDGEQAAATQLMNLMAGKSMLGSQPPPQPTDQEMFGHLAVSEEMEKSANKEWSNSLNNFFAEASKPLSQRFNSEEEELAYWSKIKIADRDDGKSGY